MQDAVVDRWCKTFADIAKQIISLLPPYTHLPSKYLRPVQSQYFVTYSPTSPSGSSIYTFFFWFHDFWFDEIE